MKIVLDTNVLVAGLLSPFGPCGEIIRMVSSGNLTLAFDSRIISEYSAVLRRPKFKLDERKVTALLDYIEQSGHKTASTPLLSSLPDPSDEPFLEIAIAGQVTCLITGNQGHYPAKLRQGVTVFSPAGFLTFYRKLQKRKST